MATRGNELPSNSEYGPLAYIVPRIVPSEGMELPEKNRTLTSPSTEFEVHIIEDVPGVSQSVSQFYPEFEGVFPDSLVLKICGTLANEFFINGGEIGQESIRRETSVALRDQRVPIVLGLGWVKREEGGRMALFPQPADGREAAMVMCNYVDETAFGAVVEAPLSSAERREIMEQSVKRMLALKVPMSAEDARSFDPVVGTRALIGETLDRAFNWRREQWGVDPSQEAKEAHRIFKVAFSEWIEDSDTRQFLQLENERGAFGDQHGDPRLFDNASIVRRSNGSPVTIIRDPVRLFLRDRQDWSNFHLCHDLLQLGCLLARPFTDPKHRDLFRYGFEAYERMSRASSSNILGDQMREKLFGIGLAYGPQVEIVVRGYVNDEGAGPVIDDYWRIDRWLSESNFLGWKEEL